MKLTLIVLFVLVVVVLGGALAVGPGSMGGFSSSSGDTSGILVRVEVAEVSTLIEMVKAPGTIEPKKQVQLSSEISSKIEELPFEEGEHVKKGDVVVRLDDRNLLASLDSAKARRDGESFRLQSEQARLQGVLSNLNFAKRELERKQQLYDSGDVSRRELDDAMERAQDLDANVEAAKYNISVLESSLVSAKADIDLATEALSKTVITAPMDGVISALNAEVGEVVLVGTMNNPGTVILTIADLDRMLLTAEVSENDIAKVGLGQTARVYINGFPDEVFSGTVTHIALQRSQSASGGGFFATEIELDLQGKLVRSGHTANADVEVAEHNGIVVPSQAILDRAIEDLPDDVRNSELVNKRKSVAYVVYKVVDGKAEFQAVHAGASDLTHQLVVKGLEPGDTVVVGPYKALLDELSDGAAVRVDTDDDAPATEDDAAIATDDEEADDSADAESTTSLAADGTGS